MRRWVGPVLRQILHRVLRQTLCSGTVWRLEQACHAAASASWPVPERTCPLCGQTGNPIRPEALCRGCGSLERHRVFGLWLEADPDALRGQRALHVAPERPVRRLLEALAGRSETPEITRDRDRTRHVGQSDHVRYDGRDVRARLRAAGVVLSEHTAVERHVLRPGLLRPGLLRGETLFLARRPVP